MTGLRLLPHVRSLTPYPPGRPISEVAREFGLDQRAVIKLASNENPHGCPPGVSGALQRQTETTALYPDFDCFSLREALSNHLDVPPDHVLPGAGSSDLIQLAARAYLGPGLKAILPQYSVVAHAGAALSVGADVVTVPCKTWQPDLDAMVEAVDLDTRLLYLASPNNPTGAMVAVAELERFVERLPDHVLLVLDQAYDEFLPSEERPSLHRLRRLRPTLLVLRNFSKIYGLAGLRVGYGIADPTILTSLRTLQTPFCVSGPAQCAAIEALGDQSFVEGCRLSNAAERERVRAAFDALGMDVLPSGGNFLLVHVGDGAGVTRALLQQGLIVRPVDGYGLHEWVRISIGLPEHNDCVLKALQRLLGRLAGL